MQSMLQVAPCASTSKEAGKLPDTWVIVPAQRLDNFLPNSYFRVKQVVPVIQDKVGPKNDRVREAGGTIQKVLGKRTHNY